MLQPKYLKDENGNKFYPIGHTDVLYDSNGDNFLEAFNDAADAIIGSLAGAASAFETFSAEENAEIGMRWIEGASTPQIERVIRQNGITYTGSYLGLEFSVNDDGSFKSSYDNLPIFRDMTRVTVNGNVMVRIPKYYIWEGVVGVWHYVWISKAQRDGYRRAGIFGKNDYYYIGAYLSDGNYDFDNEVSEPPERAYYLAEDYWYVSDAPANSVKGRSFSTKAFSHHAVAAYGIGDGWCVTPVHEWSDFWTILPVIEFGTKDLSSVVSGDWDYANHNYVNGVCDDVTNLNGIKKLYGSNNPFVWRGIENPWGIGSKVMDKVVCAGEYLYCGIGDPLPFWFNDDADVEGYHINHESVNNYEFWELSSSSWMDMTNTSIPYTLSWSGDENDRMSSETYALSGCIQELSNPNSSRSLFRLPISSSAANNTYYCAQADITNIFGYDTYWENGEEVRQEAAFNARYLTYGGLYNGARVADIFDIAGEFSDGHGYARLSYAPGEEAA